MQVEVEDLRRTLEQASSAGVAATADWQHRAEAAEREVVTVRERARALMEEKDDQISSLRVQPFPKQERYFPTNSRVSFTKGELNE